MATGKTEALPMPSAEECVMIIPTIRMEACMRRKQAERRC